MIKPQYYEHDDVWVAVPKPRKLRDLIRSEILNALAYTAGSQTDAARLLGVTPRALNWQLQTYGIPLAHAGEGRQTPGRKPKRLSGSPARS
jgi:transcriptional regulator with GAF, ATPase, and Fis domain